MLEQSFLLVIETKDDVLAPILVEPDKMTHKGIWRIVSSVVRGSLGQMQYRGGDFELVKIEDDTPLLAVAKQVGGLWLVPHPRDEEKERARAWELRKAHTDLAHHSVFELQGLDRPRDRHARFSAK